LWNRQYSLDGGETWQDANEDVMIDEDGAHDLHVRGVDSAQVTTAEGSLELNIDSTPPEVSLAGVEDDGSYAQGHELEVSASITDATSGVAGLTLLLDGEEVDNHAVLELEPGQYELVASGVDTAGNITDVARSFEVELDERPGDSDDPFYGFF